MRDGAPAPSSNKPQLPSVQSTWSGHTLARIEAMKREARQLDHQGDVQNAEKMFREALAGF